VAPRKMRASRLCRGFAEAVRLSRILVFLAYISVYVFSPFTTVLLRVTDSGMEAPATCSCPMCRTNADGSHHCSCCAKGKQCECGISPHQHEEFNVLLLEAGILSSSPDLTQLLEPEPLFSSSVLPFSDQDPSVPTPPPRF
jgi:hypothetical protein